MGERRKINEAVDNEFYTSGRTHYPRHELTGQKTENQCALAAEPHCRTMLENASVGLCAIDGAGFFLACNPPLLNMLGYAYEELCTLTISEVTHPDDREISRLKFQELFEGRLKSYSAEKRYLRKDGSVIWADATEVAIGDRIDRPNRLVVTLCDITRLKEDELELRSTLRLSEQAKADAESAGRATSQFLANMKHELRTPLNIILGYSQLLQDQWAGDLNDKQICYIKEVSEASRHLLKIINDVLEFAKLDCDTADLKLSNAVSTSSGSTSREEMA